MTLQTAYDSGLIKLGVEVAPEDKKGDRLHLVIETYDKPLTITLLMRRPACTTSTTASSVASSRPDCSPAMMIICSVRGTHHAIAARASTLTRSDQAIANRYRPGELEPGWRTPDKINLF